MNDELTLDCLKAENAKLRDELAKWERLADGIDLPEYPVSQFMPKDIERENAKLRELCREMFRDFRNCDYELTGHGRTFMPVTRYLDRMRDLGIEV